jgi:hypothetical protein
MRASAGRNERGSGQRTRWRAAPLLAIGLAVRGGGRADTISFDIPASDPG